MTPPTPPEVHAPVIDGLVLAAGRSRRMRQPKPLLSIDDETFLERAIRVLIEGGCRAVIVVLSSGAGDEARLAEQAGAKVVVNDDPESQQADSLRIGLGALESEAEAVVVLPVDHPIVRVSTVQRVLEAFRRRGAVIARPSYLGVPGHPTLFARRLFDELMRTDLPEGARTVVAENEDAVTDVPVQDPGVTSDVDSPDDYRQLVKGSP